MDGRMPDGQELAVVVRYTAYDSHDPSSWISLMAAFYNSEDADREAARLNRVARDPKRVKYFVKMLKISPIPD